MATVTVRVEIFREYLPNESHNGGGRGWILLHQVTHPVVIGIHVCMYVLLRPVLLGLVLLSRPV